MGRWNVGHGDSIGWDEVVIGMERAIHRYILDIRNMHNLIGGTCAGLGAARAVCEQPRESESIISSESVRAFVVIALRGDSHFDKTLDCIDQFRNRSTHISIYTYIHPHDVLDSSASTSTTPFAIQRRTSHVCLIDRVIVGMLDEAAE